MTLDAARAAKSEAETRLIGRTLGRLMRAGDVVLLEGSLGAGKTTLVRAVAEGMGLATGAVASPTFVVVHEYGNGDGDSRPGLIHVDAFRLGQPAELDSIGWDAVMERVHGGEPRAALIVEWPERLGAEALEGLDAARVRIEHAGQEARELALSLPDSWRSRPGLADLLARQATVCPVTGAPVPADSPTYPFSSERARMADLHRWFSGGYTISREIRGADLEEEA